MPNLYRIYFSRDSTVLPLPINPEKLPETKESKTVSTMCWASAPSCSRARQSCVR